MHQDRAIDQTQTWQSDLDHAPYVMVYDGECVLCDGFFQFVLKRDRKQQVRFVIGQSPLGQALFKNVGLPHENFTTILVFRDGKAFTKVDALAELVSGFGGLWRMARLIRLVPHVLKDPLYSLIARNRYRLFGRLDQCVVPDDALKARFLEGGFG
ncbi:MAG: DCC1-like thiol-disulfide oxidoreductase family protein [Pseudomonadota bacterium]|jgi:predicted DCC family thiol-disulfide oxidoreductase YuxK|nr:DCC1-like thiol-disulfide oxidoreductase family protein [Pseudomonadota bacterium]MEC8295104.1 DCC1-like thiol-disulfide oxidoreductase family protein [Pseudomonadota bacterium]